MAPPHSSPPPPNRTAQPSSDTLAHPGALRFESDRLPWQRSLRWGGRARDRRLLLLGFLLALLITVLELVGFGLGMKPFRNLPRIDKAIHVVLIEPEPPPPPPPPEPEPEPPEIVRRPSRIAIEPPKVRTTPPPPRATEQTDANARIGSAGVAAPQLFNPDGSVRLGEGKPLVAPSSKPENPREAAKARWAEIEKRGNPLNCKKTRFANAFSKDESLGDKVAGKYLKWVGLADPEAIAHRRQQRAEDGGCEPAQ